MKKNYLGLIAAAIMVAAATPSYATVLFYDDFETGWTGDYANGWVNTAYRHGAPPVGQMMQQTTTAHGGSYGLQLTAASVAEPWMWWAGVSVESLDHVALDAAYNPYVSVWYYDEGTANASAGQLFAVPDWVNPYLAGGEDWTDVQYGARFNNTDDYYYVAAGESSPGWVDSGEARSDGWHNLMFQLSSSDGRIHFFLDGIEIGASYRNDYTNLGTEIGLFTQFDPANGPQNGGTPYTIWDDFEVGSDFAPVPEPATMTLMGMGLAALAARRRFGARK